MSKESDKIGCWPALGWFTVGLLMAFGSQVVAGFMLHDAWAWFVASWSQVSAPSPWLLIGILSAIRAASWWGEGNKSESTELTRSLIVKAVGKSVGWLLGRLFVWGMLWLYYTTVVA